MKNYYKILGVSQSANSEAIKRAYRNKAKTYHPDISSAKISKEQFQLINEAYQVLKDEQKRRLYDHRLKQSYIKQKMNYNKVRTPYYGSYAGRPFYASRSTSSSSGNYKHEKILDNILFLFMILVGFYAIGFGVYQLFFTEVEDVNPMAGIISGLIFTFVIVYAYITRIKR